MTDRLVVGVDLLLTPEAYAQIRTEVARSELVEFAQNCDSTAESTFDIDLGEESRGGGSVDKGVVALVELVSSSGGDGSESALSLTAFRLREMLQNDDTLRAL